MRRTLWTGWAASLLAAAALFLAWPTLASAALALATLVGAAIVFAEAGEPRTRPSWLSPSGAALALCLTGALVAVPMQGVLVMLRMDDQVVPTAVLYGAWGTALLALAAALLTWAGRSPLYTLAALLAAVVAVVGVFTALPVLACASLAASGFLFVKVSGQAPVRRLADDTPVPVLGSEDLTAANEAL